jgi:hypothetical protein
LAIVGTLLDDGSASPSAGANQLTASVSPAANALILVAVAIYSAQSGSTGVDAVTGNGITYTLVASGPSVDDGFGPYQPHLYRGMSASPSAGAITINPTYNLDPVQVDWCVAEFTGVDTGGTNGADAVVQSNSNSTNENATLTITLSAFGSADNGAFGSAITYNDGTITHETNWTELDQNSNQMHAQWRDDNDTTCTFVSSNSGDDLSGIAVEIKAAAAAGDTYEKAGFGLIGP